MQTTSYSALKGCGPNTVVFDVPLLRIPEDSTEVNYTVKVTGMVRDGVPLEHTYTVKLIDGNVEGTSTPDQTPPHVRENIVVAPAPPVFGESGFTIRPAQVRATFRRGGKGRWVPRTHRQPLTDIGAAAAG